MPYADRLNEAAPVDVCLTALFMINRGVIITMANMR